MAAIAVVAAAVVVGLLVAGPPSTERERRADARRVRDLAEIGRAVDLYVTRHGSLPEDLESLSKEAGPALGVRDPATAALYEYRRLAAGTYEVCARFQHDAAPPAEPGDFWFHRAGRQCFRLEPREVRP
jgi:hypothetical protein